MDFSVDVNTILLATLNLLAGFSLAMLRTVKSDMDDLRSAFIRHLEKC